MLNNTGNSRMDTLLKIVLIFVMSVLSFSIGAFVGKQVSDTEHRQAQLEGGHSPSRHTASVDPHSTDHQPDNALSEEDLASLTEEFVNVEKKAIKNDHHDSPNPIDKHAKKEEHKDDGHAVKVADNGDGYKKFKRDDGHAKKGQVKAHGPSSKASNRVAAGKAPTKDLAKKKKPTSVLPKSPSAAIGKYTVQVASYATEKEAKTHAEKLKYKGFSAFYIPAQVRGKPWYRVSVGLFSTYKSAMVFRKELMASAGVKSSIVQKIVK